MIFPVLPYIVALPPQPLAALAGQQTLRGILLQLLLAIEVAM
jgi:hypothetical protein